VTQEDSPEGPAAAPGDAAAQRPEASVAAGLLVWLLAEKCEEAVASVDADWRYRFVNAAALRMMRRESADKVIGKVIWEVFPTTVGSRFEENGQIARREGREVLWEEYYATTRAWYRVRAVPDPGVSYASRGVTFLVRDITTERQHRAQRLLDAGLVGIVYWSIDGRLMDANDTFLEMLGYTREDLAAGQLNWIQMTPPDMRERDERPMADLLATGRHLPFEKEFLRKDGARVPVLVAAAFHEGSRTGGVAFVVDITAQKEAQDQLRLALASGDLGTWDSDVRAGTVTFSEEVPPLYGRPRAPVTITLQEWLESWVHPDDRERMVHAMENVLQGEPDHGVHFRTLWPDGKTSRWVATRGLFTRDIRGEPVRAVGYIRDITEEMEREAEREAMHRRQRQFMRDLLCSLTEGRFRLCLSPGDLPPPLPLEHGPVPLELSRLHVLRHQVRAVAARLCYDRERAFDLELAVGEAAMNTHVHGGGSGEGRVGADAARGVIQVWVRDHGHGIAEEALPKVLEKGVSTAGTLGHGFSMILKTADRIWLLTGPEGTTVVLEQDRLPEEPSWLQLLK
jgi:PAS domain S-box